VKTLLMKAGVAATPLVLVIASPAVAQQARRGGRGGGGGGIQAVTPDSRAIPGGEQAATLLAGAMWFVLACCALALLYGAGKLGWGKVFRNHHHMESGGNAIALSLGGAFIAGAAFVLINWAFGLGASVTP